MDFQERYNNFKRELRDLKTAHDMRSNMRTFFSSATVPYMYSFTPTTLRVTYASGNQPIMTTAIGEPQLIPLTPNGDVQDFVLAIKPGTLFYDKTFNFLSTRKIDSIQIIQS